MSSAGLWNKSHTIRMHKVHKKMTVTYLEHGDIKGHGPASSETNNTEEAVTKTLLTIQTVFLKLISVTNVQVTKNFYISVCRLKHSHIFIWSISTSKTFKCKSTAFITTLRSHPNPLSNSYIPTSTAAPALKLRAGNSLWTPKALVSEKTCLVRSTTIVCACVFSSLSVIIDKQRMGLTTRDTLAMTEGGRKQRHRWVKFSDWFHVSLQYCFCLQHKLNSVTVINNHGTCSFLLCM